MSKPYRVEWRPIAQDDLRAVIRYIGKDNPARSVSFGEEMRNKIASLATHAEIGRTGRLPDTRELVVHPNYIVVYRVLNDRSAVQILRIKHAAQQFP
jgi:addiction module RelE/StbE family toxin